MKDRKQYEGLMKHSRESNEFAMECLKKAMVQLASEEDYKEISVTRLCEKAGVSRMTFYRNYSVTNDIIFEIARELNQEVVDTIGSPFRSSTSREWYIKAFEMLELRSEEMKLMFRENFQYQWMKIVNSLAVHDPDFAPEKQFQRLMWSGGFENALSYWLNNGMKQTPEEMAEYCIRYLPHLLAEE